ncbi:rRNA biogenesis protein rrp5 [Coemansia sp. IMI 209128]|nr:rRNA biogenesis protein rrp5 [Coemansia sp. RSA 2530]KAJ2702101.1 rRNA biogenesis protein rrp5 [Coemansia sp. IMI 209128]
MAGKGDKTASKGKHSATKGEKAAKEEKKKAPRSAAVDAGDFPRGGSNGLTPLEFREVSRQAEREVLFSDGVTGGGSAGKKKRRGADDGSEKKAPKKTKKKPAGNDGESTSADVDDGSLLDDDRLCPVQVLSFKRLTKGALVLGCISAIRDLELLVSLPNGLVGVVPITSISTELTALVEKAAASAEESDDEDNDDAMDVDSDERADDPLDLKLRFFVGQYVKCVVSELSDAHSAQATKQKKGKNYSRIELTLMPEEINDRFDRDDMCEGLIVTASVKSVEDRGYVLNTGISSDRVAAFLPTGDAQAWLERWMPHATELRVGQLVEAVVTKITDDHRSLRLTINPAVVAQATAKDTFKTMASVQPGQLVPATVLKVWDRGLSLRFMGFYDCSASLSGLGLAGARDASDIKKKYDLGDIVNVRVLYVSLTTAAKTVIVSTQPHVLALQPRPALTGFELPLAARLATGNEPASEPADSDITKRAPADAGLWPIPYGTVLDDCVVLNSVGNIGVVLQIPGTESVHAFATAANLVEEDTDAPLLQKHAGLFHIGSSHRARVIGYDALDATVRVSLRPSVVDQQFLTVNDVLPGMVVSGTVKRLKENGAEIAISPTVQGFVHRQHLSDAHLKHPELQFTPGKKVTCRVLRVAYEKGSVTLTCRKSLVQSKLPVVTGFAEAEGAVPGAVAMAVVDRAVNGGTVVNFYQGARGFIATDTAGAKQLEAGQVVKCRILSTDLNKRRIWASLNVDLDVPMSEILEQAKPASRTAAYSTDVSQVSIGDVVSGVVVKISEPNITLRLDGSDLCASISFGHLSDHRGTILDKAIARIKPGVALKDLVVVSINGNSNRVIVSAKPALVKAARANCIARSAVEIVKGKTLVGWITGTTNFGAFVAFPGSVSALAPLDMLADRFVASPADLFYVDQTVVASVASVEEVAEGDRKIRVSLKGSAVDLAATGCIGPAEFLLEYFDELEGLSGSELLSQIGSQTLVSVKQKHPYGLVVSPVDGDDGALSETSSGFVTIDQAKERIDECKEDSVVAACVLDVDPEKGIVDYSLRSALVPVAVKLEAADKASVAADKKKAKSALTKALAEHASKTAAWRKSLSAACEKKSTTQLVVEVVKEDYLVLSLPLHGNLVAFAMTKSYNDRSKPFMRFKVGQRLSGIPVRVESNRRTLVQLQQAVTDKAGGSTSDAKEGAKRAAVRPVDPAINFFEDYAPGLATLAKVTSIKGVQANLDLASNIKGRLHISELFDDATSIAAKSPSDVFAAAGVRLNASIPVKVIGLYDAKGYKFLPITHRASPLKTLIDVTVRPSLLASKWTAIEESDSRLVSWKSVKPGDKFTGFVKGVQEGKHKGKTVVLVALNTLLSGHLPILAATSSFEIASHPARHFIPGMPIEVQVSSIDPKSKEVILAPCGNFIAGIERPIASRKLLVPGARIICSVYKTLPTVMYTEIDIIEGADEANGKAPRITRVHGSVDACHAADELSAKPFSSYSAGKLLEAVVVWVGADTADEHIKVGLSLRPSVLDPVKFPPSGATDPVISSAADVNVGQVVRGYIKKTSEVGCFVGLGRDVVGRALISELSDEYIRDVKDAFPSDKLVSAVVTEVNRELNRISLSLRPSRIGDMTSPDGSSKRRLDQIKVGETLKGTVTRIEEYGVFIKPDDSFVTGLCYIREIADSETPVDPKALYEVGDRVLAKVLNSDLAKNRLALGLKASYFVNAGDSDSDEDEEMESVASSDGAEDDDDNASDSDANAQSEDGVSADEDALSEDDAESSDDDEEPAKQALGVSGGFQWGDEAEANGRGTAATNGADSEGDAVVSSDESSDEEDNAQDGKKKKNAKRSRMERIAQDVTAELSEQAPTRATDFERLIVGSPNSSFVWLQFMAFYLGQSEVDQARAVAERALKTISPREEQEKMNVWVGLLNLEHRFGSKETLDSVLKRAIQFMNPKHTYLQMAKIYERADQFAEAENMHKIAISKFSGSCKVWVLFGLFYLKHGKVAESRDLLARALQPLPKRKHIKAITQFGQMEFKHGEPERGRTVFEGVLGTYPKRVDLWSVYLDMETKVASTAAAAGSQDEHCWQPARKLFERVTSMKHSSKKMKFFFKKWLAFEKAHGSDASTEHVKQRALEYVNSLSS